MECDFCFVIQVFVKEKKIQLSTLTKYIQNYLPTPIF